MALVLAFLISFTALVEGLGLPLVHSVAHDSWTLNLSNSEKLLVLCTIGQRTAASQRSERLKNTRAFPIHNIKQLRSVRRECAGA